MVTPPRFVVGIDLGTTNCALAWADLTEVTSAGTPRIHRFAVPQVVAPSEVRAEATLPSFLYLPAADEQARGELALPWASRRDRVAGAWARDHGALLPGRLVTSAKSWLCHAGVDRRAPILPWEADPADRVCSPLDASTAYLVHLRDAWNHAMATGADDRRLEFQHVVLTVPASFDEEARELTVEAAEAAGLTRLTLQEEPTAALYAWLAGHRHRMGEFLRRGDTVLVCDVGGGTSDFTLVSVARADEDLCFERVSVGEHLLLGGDNLDLALARLIESRLDGGALSLRQRQALRRQSAGVKERLLSAGAPERAPVSLLGSGGRLVGGSRVVEVEAEEVRRLLVDGFLPDVEPDDRPRRDTRAGLRELGLPYEADPAITRHLAAFLASAAEGGAAIRPDVVLLNGGFFAAPVARDCLVHILRRWFAPADPAWNLRVLANEFPATAVAEGAVAYGLTRHGLGPRIGGGSPRAYYVGLQSEVPGTHDVVRAVCVLPRGTEPGTVNALASTAFEVVANRLRAFSLWSSRTRRDGVGEVVDLQRDDVHPHSPLVTELRFGKRSRAAMLPVRLDVGYTELGTLELWLSALQTDHRWRLRFELRAPAAEHVTPGGDSHAMVSDEATSGAVALIASGFAPGAGGGPSLAPDQLTAALEARLGLGRHAWPVAAIRPLCDALLEHAEGRRLSARHEARWLNLLGFCLRPGFGATLDDWRMTQARRVYLAGLGFPGDLQCQAEWLVLWQRLAGGLTAGQQQDLYQRHAPPLLASLSKRGKRLPPQVERETWRLLASLERLPPGTRAALGDALVGRLERQRENASLWWALGRVGARTPTYGPLNTVVAPSRAQAWLDSVLEWSGPAPERLAALTDLAAFTGDAGRDIDELLRTRVESVLRRDEAPETMVTRLWHAAAASASDLQRRFGESLPEGLSLVAKA